MRIKQAIATMLCLALGIGGAPVLAAEEEKVYADYQFDSELTNKSPDYIQLKSGSARIVDAGTSNKALLMDESCSKIYTELGALPPELVISMELKRNTQTVSAGIGFSDSANGKVSKLFSVEKNIVKTTDGKIFANLNDREFTELKFVINKKNLMDIYVGGNRVVKQWKNKAAPGKGLMAEKAEGGLLFDNIAVYAGNDRKKKMPEVAFLNDGDAYFHYDYRTNADMALVDTENIFDVSWDSGRIYRNSVRNDKGNTLILNRLDERLNPDRENGYIIMERFLETDVHLDFNSLYEPNAGYFPYYFYEGNLKVEKFGSPVKFAYFRDSVSNSGNVDVNAAYINGTGQVISSSGKVIKKLKQNQWMNYWFVFDLENNACDFYIDGELVDSLKYNAGFKQPSMLRVWIDVGGGNTRVIYDKLKVLGMRNKFNPERPDSHPSFFSPDDGIEEFLQGKTAFYAYSENVFANGEKQIRVDKPIKDDNDTEFYVSAKALSLGYGFALQTNAASKTAADGVLSLTAGSETVAYEGKEYTMKRPCKWEKDTLYIPIDTFAEDVLKHCVRNDGNGLVITAKEPFYLDETEPIPDYLIAVATRNEGYTQYPVTPIKAINWYMSFERPESAEIREDFNKTTNNGAVHPRAVASKADFDRIRETRDTDETMKVLVDQIVHTADGFLGVEPGKYNIPDKQRILDQARAYLGYLMPLGFAYQVTGEKKYADKVWELFETLLEFPDWNPSHMIDTGELVGAVGVSYDWCYDYFTPEQRQYIYDRVKTLGIKPIADAQKDLITTRVEWAGANDFVASKSNFNTVINGGELVALTAFAEMEPDYIFDVMKETMRSLEYSTLVWRPAGLWIESSSYWSYASQYFTKGMGSVLNATGQHYGILDGQGIDRTGTWIRGMASYGGLNNFHDAGAGKLLTPYTGWYAKVYQIPALAASTVNQVLRGERTASPEDAVWYIPNNPATEDDMPRDIWTAGFDTVSSHASYTDHDALFFSTHGGKVVCYHSQYDVATFVMDLMGVRWVDDLGSDDYNIRRDNDGFNKMYRDIAEGHSVMVFNNGVPGQHPDGCAEMTRWETKDKGCIAAYDLTSVYKDDVTSAARGFYVGDNRRSLTVRDEFTANKDMPAHWFIQTGAAVEIVDNHTAILSKQGKKLKMEVVTDVEDYKLVVGDARPLPTSPDIKGQNPNKGYSRIDVEMNLKANKAQHVTVKLSPYREATEDVSNMNLPIAQWQLPDGEFIPREALNVKLFANGKAVEEIMTNGKIGIIEGEPVPEITAVPEKSDTIVEIFPKKEGEDFVVVRAYSADKSYYVDNYVEFSVSKAADTSALTEIPVTSVHVSSTPEPENHKENMFDNDYTTRWTSANASGETAVFDLGESKRIDSIGLAFWRGDTRNYYYTIFVSENGNDWTQVADGGSSGTTEGLEIVDINAAGRYIKFLGGGNSVNGHSNILEFRVYQNQ